MISRIEGQLVAVRMGELSVRIGGLTYDVLYPVGDEVHWREREGEAVELHTFEYLESQGQGTAFLPRLIGFISPRDRSFFEMFTRVKGIGYRKALRAMAMPVGPLAEAIASRDVAVLKSLPEIGKRTAETIVTDLHDKMQEFLDAYPTGAASANGRAGSRFDEASSTAAGAPGEESVNARPGTSRHAMARDALAVLMQLGENRAQAVQCIDRVLAEIEEIESVEQLVNAAFRYREG